MTKLLCCLSALIPFTLVLPLGHAQKTPQEALGKFKVSPGLEISLWASEPLMVNPTCMDIDHKGRVWICESVNYRCKLRNLPLKRPEGDRILVLEDTKGTGQADKVTVFYQSPEIHAPMGIAVLPHSDGGPGCTVYVCQSPDILVFVDKTGTGKADGPPRKLLSGFRGIDHDHGVHGILIGPDGKLYFTVGDQGVQNLVDKFGRKWSSNNTDCQAGTTWRCDLDGKNLELLAHNFRNHYEPCVDSFGTIFTSDNDDDGTQQTRICYVMPGGNYGYHHSPRVSHWNEEMPGVVPKILRTYFGSPTGMCVYEGNLLQWHWLGQAPLDFTTSDFLRVKNSTGNIPVFTDEGFSEGKENSPPILLLHTDAGPRHVREYWLTAQGAGYGVRRFDIVESNDSWFRPTDVCVAPDGSAFVADWYDPGVGGHGIGDWTRGRVYRLAPKGYKSVSVKVDLQSNEGITTALASPNIAIRSAAITKIQSMGLPRALEVLGPAAVQKENVYLRARALWQMGKLGHLRFVSAAFEDSDPRFRILSMRILADMQGDTPEAYLPHWKRLLVKDPSPAVRREALLLLRRADPAKAKDLILDLADGFDGKDRFYLAAVGIAVGQDSERRKIILADFEKRFPDLNDKVMGLLWELRRPIAVPVLLGKLSDAHIPPALRSRYVDWLANSSDSSALPALLKVLANEKSAEVRERIVIDLKTVAPARLHELVRNVEVGDIIDSLFHRADLRESALTVVELTGHKEKVKQVIGLAQNAAEALSLRAQAVRTLGVFKTDAVTAQLLIFAEQQDFPIVLREQAVLALGQQGTPTAEKKLQTLAQEGADVPLLLRQAAVAGLASHKNGAEWLLEAHAKKNLRSELTSDLARLLRNSPFKEVKEQARKQLPAPAKLDPKNLPSMAALLARRGDTERGRHVMELTLKNEAACLKCHTINNVGGKVGPDLSVIGSKASRENLLESILYPSRAIADQYAAWVVETNQGLSITGVIAEETPQHLLLLDVNAKEHKVAVKDIETRTKSQVSLMPDNLILFLPENDLLDVVEYLYSLKSVVLAPAALGKK